MSNNKYKTGSGVSYFEKQINQKKEYKIIKEDIFNLLMGNDFEYKTAKAELLKSPNEYIISSYTLKDTKISSRLNYDRNKRKTPKYEYIFQVKTRSNIDLCFYYYRFSDILVEIDRERNSNSPKKKVN